MAKDIKGGYPPKSVALTLVLAGLSALLFWWAWETGAYFDAVFLPGAIGVFLLVILFLLSRVAPLDGRELLGGLALALLAAWMLLSLLWTPTAAAAVEYAGHALLYAAVFAVGAWIRRLLGRQGGLAVAPVACAGVAIGIAVTIAIGTGADASEYLYGDGTLQFPLGYRNAEAAFFLISLWPVLALACDRERAWLLRAPMIGGAIVLAELAVLAQSRGSVPAAVVAAVAWIAFSPGRLRAVICLLLVAVPVALAVPTLLDVFQYGDANGYAASLLHDSARVIATTALLGMGLAAVLYGWLEHRVQVGADAQRAIGAGLAVVALLAAATALAAFLVDQGGPASFVDQRVGEFTHGGIPDLSAHQARFGVNVGSNRDDFWRVSLNQVREAPLLGKGAGSFQIDYLRHRRSPESPRDPHSTEMLMLGEFGLPGFGLLCLFLVVAAAGAVRSRRLGLSAAWLSASVLAALSYWLMHASYDWFWNYPAVTAPVAYLAGTAVSPTLRMAVDQRPLRLTLAGVLAIVVLLLIPLYLSERYRERALGEWQQDSAKAYADLEQAASLNPTDAEPLLLEGQVASSLGNQEKAIKALRRAEERQPEYFVPYYLAAKLLAGNDPVAARQQLARARRLNPRGPQIAALSRRMDGANER